MKLIPCMSPSHYMLYMSLCWLLFVLCFVMWSLACVLYCFKYVVCRINIYIFYNYSIISILCTYLHCDDWLSIVVVFLHSSCILLSSSDPKTHNVSGWEGWHKQWVFITRQIYTKLINFHIIYNCGKWKKSLFLPKLLCTNFLVRVKSGYTPNFTFLGQMEVP